LDQIANGGVAGQEKHQIRGVLCRLFDDLVKVGEDVVKGILIEQVIATAAPWWTHEHGIELPICIIGWNSLERITLQIGLLVAFELQKVPFKHLKVDILA